MASDSVFHKAIPDPALVASVDRYLKEQESKRAETALQCQKALVYIDAYEKLRQAIELPDAYAINAVIVIGKPGPREALPPELQAREEPNGRLALSALAFEGTFQ